LTGRAHPGETAPRLATRIIRSAPARLRFPGPRKSCRPSESVKKYDVERRTRRTRRKTLSILLRWFRGFCVVRDYFTRSSGLLKRVMGLPSSFEDTCKSW